MIGYWSSILFVNRHGQEDFRKCCSLISMLNGTLHCILEMANLVTLENYFINGTSISVQLFWFWDRRAIVIICGFEVWVTIALCSSFHVHLVDCYYYSKLNVT